jgi:hypothetical protein
MKGWRSFFLVAALASAAWAQTDSGLFGIVKDQTGASLPAAVVTIRNVETGAVRKLATDQAGRYAAPSLAIGPYEVRAEKPGFAPQTKTGIYLVVGQEAAVDLTLEVGELSQQVDVMDSLASVNLSTSSTSGLVGEREVKDLPLNGRSYDGLLGLNPGTVNYTSERSGGIGTSNSAVGSMFAVSGRRPQENLFLLNGIEYTGASEINVTPGGASGQLLGVEAVREFNVVSGNYGAQYGKRPGAQIGIVTASGANQPHGSVYEFLRNSALDARNSFDFGDIPQFERNEFGASAGGAIQRDKTFVFGNYEGFRQHLGLSDVTLVPDNNARAGYLPNSSGTLSYVGLAPGAQRLLALWPVENGPNLGGGIGEAYSHPLQTIREDFGTLRLDHNFSDKDTLFGVYTVDDSQDRTPSANPLSLVFEALREQVGSAQETHVFSASALNSTRLGYSRASYFFTGQTPVNIPGWVEGAPIGTVVIGGGTALNGASQITQAGTNAGSNLSAVRNLFTYEDHVSLTRGIHHLEAGVWIQRIQNNDNLAQNQYGQASFGSLTSFLQGTVGTFTVVPASALLGWRSLEAAEYVQDSVRLGKRLEVSLGFRMEHSNGMHEAHGRASNYGFDANGVIQTQPTVGDSVFTVNHGKFLPEPRAALAWDPFGRGKTVLHAGFGIYHEQLDSLSYRLDQNGPFNTTVTLKNVSLNGLTIVPGAAPPSGSLVLPSGIQPDARIPMVESYTFKVEQELAPSLSVSAGYTGSRGRHQILSIDANLAPAAICPASSCPASLPAGALYIAPGTPLANPNVANTTTWWSSGHSNYNALQVDLSRRLARGFQIRGAYTLSKSLDDGTAWNSSVGANAPGFVMYPPDTRLDWGPSTYDVRHALVIHGLWELPLGRGRGTAGKLLGGWTLSGIATVQSGFPFTPQLGYNPSNDGDSRNPIRPSWNPAFQGPVIEGSPSQYFNPAAFAAPASGTYGNVGRDTLTGPGTRTIDLSVVKNTPISERLKVQFRAEVFNVPNHANFATPNTVVFSSASSAPSATAGLITATSTASRQIQFGLKALW